MSNGNHKEVLFRGHSDLVYWWPVWITAFILAFLTWRHGVLVTGDGIEMSVLANQGPGVVFFAILSLVILVTNVCMRGLASVVAILAVLLAVVLLAYFKQWDGLLRLVGLTAIHFSLVFYVLFASVLFLMWMAVYFFYDRLTLYRLQPGQFTQEYLLGVGKKSWNTSNMKFEKVRDDPF